MKTTDSIGADLYATLYVIEYQRKFSQSDAAGVASLALHDYHRATGYPEKGQGWED